MGVRGCEPLEPCARRRVGDDVVRDDDEAGALGRRRIPTYDLFRFQHKDPVPRLANVAKAGCPISRLLKAEITLEANPGTVEAAHFACRFDDQCRRFYDRKKQQTNPVIATKSLACKLAKAAWHVMAANVPYDATRVFGPGKKKDFGETGREPAKGSGHPSQ